MKITNRQYQQLAKSHAPRSLLIKDCISAFVYGGTLCALGQVAILLAGKWGFEPKDARLLGSLTLIALSVLLTGFNVYDTIAKRAGAGTLVPITGFANSMASPAMEFKSEGFVLGLGAKMFSIAGPVIVYGTVASVIYGIIYWIIKIL